MDNLPSEIICLIYKSCAEKSRRNLKLTSKHMRDCYIAYIQMTKNNPPKFRLCQDYRPCNHYKDIIPHECICSSRVLIGWEKY